MEHAFITSIDTLGSAGHVLDIVTLSGGDVVVFTEETVVHYPSRAAFDAGAAGRTLSRRSAAANEQGPLAPTLHPV